MLFNLRKFSTYHAGYLFFRNIPTKYLKIVRKCSIYCKINRTFYFMFKNLQKNNYLREYNVVRSYVITYLLVISPKGQIPLISIGWHQGKWSQTCTDQVRPLSVSDSFPLPASSCVVFFSHYLFGSERKM